ncbi:MAG: CsgG/HfaB family protein [Polyangia bacterium]
MAARESWHWVAAAIGALAVGLTGGVRAAPATAIRVAVTDFQPGSATPEDDRALGAGLQSMLTTDLAASSRIAVVERARLADLRKEMKLAHSAAADPATAVKLGRLAGATHLVTGSFTLSGKQMRLDARVIDVATGRVALATNAIGERDAFFELEKKIAGAVVDQLGVTLTPKERASFGRVHTADLQALRRFGEGLRLFDDADYDRSLAALRDATARDADFKLASTTLEEYERIAREIRSRAAVLDAKRDLDSSLQRRDLRAQEQGVVDRLVAVAAGKEGGSGARARRAAALYLAIRVLEGDAEGVDRFARERLLDGFVARYVHEADGLFPDVPMEPFEPMGEQYGEMNAPAKPGEVDAAVSAAVDRFAHYGLKDPDEVRHYKEGHIQALFGREISRVARAMHLDARRTAELTDHFYQESLKFSPRGRWRASALLVRARQRRALLDIDQSTRLFQAAAELETEPSALRSIAEQVEGNGKIAAALRTKRDLPCFREWAAYTIADEKDYAARRFTDSAKPTDFCASSTVRMGRSRLSDPLLFTGGLPAWLFQSSSRPLSVGPRASTDVTEDVRYGASGDDERSWALLILEGLPHAGAVLSLDLSFDLPADGTRCTAGRNCSATGKKPRVVALFDATDLLVRATRRGGNLLDDVPMRATAVSLAGDSAERVDAEVLLASERMGTEGPKLSAGVNQPLPLPTTGKVTVRREARQLVVEAGGRRASFDTSPARPGFVGLLFQGAGFARVTGPRVQAVH